MTNVSPFITKEQWKFQAKLTPNACESITRTVAHLDSLYEVLGSRIDLWIGHSANEGTKWVWPHFSRFVKNHRIEHWMLTGNISPQSHLAFDGHYRKAKNPRFPWFAPERLAGGD
jgi:hypothetical protein